MTERIPLHYLPDNSANRHELAAKIHTRSFTGIFRRIRMLGGTLLFALYFGTAWLNWEDRQAVLWDLSESKFHIFGSTFWPHDFILLAFLLMICAFGLFFLTVFAGRVWCGYACPQSVWSWVFMWAEKITEGDRNQRFKLDSSPMTMDKLTRRASKHMLWLMISLATAITFVGYFTPIRELVVELSRANVNGWALFWIFFFTAATYINAGWLREQVCFHMCPYGRFQSAMLDENSLVIAYDAARGESRGSRKKGTDYKKEGLGDCIDCQMCVQVCPTGIDIRNGLQMQCIGCAACVDACDSIMDKMGYAKGLVRYSSEQELTQGKGHIIRPKLIAYAAVLVAMIAAFIWALTFRPMVSVDVAKSRTLYQKNSEGEIENGYVIKIINKDQKPRYFNIEGIGMESMRISGKTHVHVEAGAMIEVPVTLAVAQSKLEKVATDIQFRVAATDGATTHAEASTFIGPVN